MVRIRKQGVQNENQRLSVSSSLGVLSMSGRSKETGFISVNMFLKKDKIYRTTKRLMPESGNAVHHLESFSNL